MSEIKRKPRVAICLPTGTHVHADFATSLAGMCIQSCGTVEFQIINVKCSLVTQARNGLVQAAIAADADYVFFLDSDMDFDRDILLSLLSHDKDIIGAVYRRRTPPHDMLAAIPDVPTTAVHECEGLPTGCLLIKTGVFKHLQEIQGKTKFPTWFSETYHEADQRPTGEDYTFCNAARAAGYKLWADLAASMHLYHIGEYRVGIAGPEISNFRVEGGPPNMEQPT